MSAVGDGAAAASSVPEALDAHALSQLRQCRTFSALGSRGLQELRKLVNAARGAEWVYHITLNDAVMSDSMSTLKYLVEDVKVKTLDIKSTAHGIAENGYCPIQVAVIFGKVEAMVYLLSRGADPMLHKESSVVIMGHRRQRRLKEAFETAGDGAEFEGVSITKSQIEPLLEGGSVMLEVLDGVEAYGCYRDWAKNHPFHRLARRFSADLPSAEPRYQLALLRALVLGGRASLLPAAERSALAAREAAQAKAEAKEEQPLLDALTDAGFSAEAARSIEDNLRLRTVKNLRAAKLSPDDVESRLEGLVRNRKIAEGERRRFARFVRELEEPAAGPATSAASKAGAKSTAKAKAKGAPAAKAALMALATKGAGKGYPDNSAKAPVAKPKTVLTVDGVSLLLCDPLPDNVFMLITRFLFGV